MHQERFILDINKNFFTKSVVKPRDRLPKGVVDSSCLEAFKRCAEVTPEDMARCVDVALGDMA